MPPIGACWPRRGRRSSAFSQRPFGAEGEARSHPLAIPAHQNSMRTISKSSWLYFHIGGGRSGSFPSARRRSPAIAKALGWPGLRQRWRASSRSRSSTPIPTITRQSPTSQAISSTPASKEQCRGRADRLRTIGGTRSMGRNGRGHGREGGEPSDLARIAAAPPRKKRDVFVYMISGAKVRAPAAAMALIERL